VPDQPNALASIMASVATRMRAEFEATKVMMHEGAKGAARERIVHSVIAPYLPGHLQVAVIRVTLPPAHRERIVPLTVDQVRALADAMPRRNRAMVIVQAGLGLRLGELLALRVQDVDLAARTVRVEWQIAPRSRVRSEPKTRRSRRTVPLPRIVAEAIEKHTLDWPPAEDGTLFTTRFGAPYWHDYYGTRVFGPAVAAAGLPEGTTSHDLRHHYASVLLMQGESVIVVAERLGHENANLVLSTYGHLMPDSEERTRRAVDDAWSGAPDVPQGEGPSS
jgi:integrase